MIIILFTQFSMLGQNNSIYWTDEGLFSSGECLSNTSDFRQLKLLVKPDTEVDNVKIFIEVNFKSEIFESVQAFNDFDLEFWLLENEAFKSETPLKITIQYKSQEQPNTIELFYKVCLKYVVAASRGEGKAMAEAPSKFIKLPVYFATDRNYVKTENLNDVFGTERSKLKYGICQVSIPNSHDVGQVESPSIWRFEFSEDPSKHVMIQNINVLDKEKFFKSLSKSIKKSPRKSSFLFVHGYNTSFSEAAKRTAQISYDLKFDGRAVFYSWPSQASMFKYSKDEANIEWSKYNIKRFLEDYITRSGAEDIYLVAHSMGNRGLTKALVELFNEKPELNKNIKEVILAAPDIDADVFKNDIAPQMVSDINKPITLYVSADDLALRASKLLHGNPRAGDSEDGVVLLNGVETIDATGIDTSFLCHSYFADTNSIISDIFDLINTGKRAMQRTQLTPVKVTNLPYWKVKQ
ncbi:alpha/beta hydrolase [Gaetbulibacter aestuarii]|uniref:Alpha/beta hydrolase n=1 Tax=Gaetbulibacter aestuarii TaxID=1502358 RepID=A0ABW7N1W2_9FLAO